MAMDPMDEFEFKPITEGLGFHKKAEKIKADVKSASSSLVQDRVARSVPDRAPEGASNRGSGHSNDRTPNHFGEQISSKASSLNDLATSLGLTGPQVNSFGMSSRSATQSISDLIASLPPSLDFIEDKTPAQPEVRSKSAMGSGATSKESETSRPQIFQPLGRDDYGATSAGQSMNGSGPSISAVLPAPTQASTQATMGSILGSPSGSILGSPSGSTFSSPSGSTMAGMPTSGAKMASTLAPARQPAGKGSSLASTQSNIQAHIPGPTLGSTIGSVLLPTPGSKAVHAAAAAQAVSALANASPYRGRLDESYARAFPHAEKKSDATTEIALSRDGGIDGLEAIATNVTGGLLDGMVSMGLATVLLVSILAITHINLMGLIRNADTQVTTVINLGALFMMVNLLYMLITRIFTGSSLGEWAFDLQMGSDEDRQTIVYFLKLIWRQVLLTATGFVPFALLSFILGRDILRPLSGLQLYRRVD